MLPEFSSPLNDYNLSTDDAGRMVVFARSEADFANARILVSERRGGRWSEPQPIAFTDPRYSDSDPWLTPEGRTLYFVSNRPVAGTQPRPDLDIWRSVRTPGGWSQPEHLAALSSPGPELGVELHGDTLTFSSVRKGGSGGLDIYSARVSGAGFEAPRPIEEPFNSRESDSDFTLSRDGRTALFWRSLGGKGVLHISRRSKAGWSDPAPLPSSINRGDFNFTPAFSRDGSGITFASTAPRAGQAAGMADIYVAMLPAAPK